MPDLQIGRVIKPHGVRGEVVVEPSTDHVSQRYAAGEVLRGVQTGKDIALTVKTYRPHQGRLLVSFEEIKDRTAAESLRGVRFLSRPLEDPEDDGFYDHQLVGLRVLTVGNVDADTAHARAYEGELPEPVDIGQITAVQHGPAGATLEVAVDEDADLQTAGQEILIPFKLAIVPIVDLDNEAVVITPPEGLLELA